MRVPVYTAVHFLKVHMQPPRYVDYMQQCTEQRLRDAKSSGTAWKAPQLCW